jgi:chromosome segregation ATPase
LKKRTPLLTKYNMLKNTIIIALVLVLIYLYYQNKKLGKLPPAENLAKTIFEVGEDHEELIAEKDSAIRAKNEAEQEVLSLNNRLKNKQQEVSRKEQEIERLKKDKVRTAISSNTEIQKLKKDLTSEKQQHKGSLERIVKLTEQKVSLEAEIESLKKQVKKMPGEFPTEREDK